MMMKLLRLPLVVAALALALCWLGAGVQALKPVPSKTAVKAVAPPARTDITHKLNTIDMMIAVRASGWRVGGGLGGGVWASRTAPTHHTTGGLCHRHGRPGHASY